MIAYGTMQTIAATSHAEMNFKPKKNMVSQLRFKISSIIISSHELSSKQQRSNRIQLVRLPLINSLLDHERLLSLIEVRESDSTSVSRNALNLSTRYDKLMKKQKNCGEDYMNCKLRKRRRIADKRLRHEGQAWVAVWS
jgi:hypothetical protein